MQNNVLNSLVLYQSKWFSDLVDENKLSNALLTRPYQVSTIVSHIFGKYENTSIDALTGGLNKVMVIDNRQYEWSVFIEADRAVTIRDAKWQGSAITSNLTPGINNTPIQLWLEDKWLA